MSEVLAQTLAAFASERLGRAVEVTGLRRLTGGSSHDTWAFDAVSADDVLPLVLRRDFTSGLLDSRLHAEFELMHALHGAGLAVPAPRWWVAEDSPLGVPFLVMDRVDGVDLRKELSRQPDANVRAQFGVAALRLLVQLHGLDVTRVAPDPGAGDAADQVERWAEVIDQAKADVDPLLVTALAWLRTHLPVPEHVCFVHGDFKANNLLVGPKGALTLIDWELAHVGDPVEDLAWTMLWRTSDDLVGGLLEPRAYVAAYSSLIGRRVDPDRLTFWQVFALVKLSAIFLTGMRDAPVRPSLRMLGRAMVTLQMQLADLLATATRGDHEH